MRKRGICKFYKIAIGFILNLSIIFFNRIEHIIEHSLNLNKSNK